MDAVNNLDPTKLKSESSIFRLSVLMNLLIIVFVPMKFFTFKIASVSLSFTRIFLIFAVADFALSWLGVNLTPFMGSASRFSPIIFGVIGSVLINMNKEDG